jgi:hypothetical protein
MTYDDVFAADLHLLVDGQQMRPVMRGGIAVFRLVLPATGLRLISRVNRPCDLGLNTDRRLLGLAIRALTLATPAGETRFGPDMLHPLPGFHPARPGQTLWTAGELHLPDAWFATQGEALLRVEAWTLPAYQDASPDSAANHALMLRFENLGESCELSMAQHHFGAHPTSLLRWGNTDLPRLLAGLGNGFAGLADPAHAELVWSETAREYKLRDPRYLSAHTWARQPIADATERENIRLAGGARLRLLARKLMTDLRAPRRIYVFKPRLAPLALADIQTLHATLRRIGPVRLLCVNPGATLAEAGQVAAAGDGLFIGHIDRPAHSDGVHRIWHRLCTLTARLDEATPLPAPAHA